MTTVLCTAALTFDPALSKSCVDQASVPVCQAVVEGKKVTALRDTGATTLVVQRNLVPADKVTDRTRRVVMADSSLRWEVPVAMVSLETHFYVGQAEAVVMENPVCPLLIGNVVRDENGKEHPLAAVASPETDRAAEVAKAQRERRSPGRVDPARLLEGVAKRDELMREQKSDPSLEQIRGLAAKGEQLSAGRKRRVAFFWKRGILCRSFQSGTATYEQVVVPSSLRHQVMRLAHVPGETGHQGGKKTLARVQRTFYWPGFQGEVRRFATTCATCRRVQKSTIGQVPEK